MKELLEFIAKSLVDEPSAVKVDVVEDELGVILQLKVAQQDVGKVIGKQGRIAKAVRTIVASASAKEGKRVSVDIID